MKLIYPLLGALLLQSSLCIASALQATGNLWCASARFNPATDNTGRYKIEFTTVNGFMNGEFMPDEYPMMSPYYSYLYLSDDWAGMDDAGDLYLNLPPYQDANKNGWHDFFEPSQAISGDSSGTCGLYFEGNLTVQATWSRPAGSPYGTCVIQLKRNSFTTFLTVTHGFELMEFSGPITYSPGQNGPACTVQWVQTGSPDTIYQGEMNLTRVSTDRFNELTLPAGTWTNLYTTQPWDFGQTDISRDIEWPTNYYGFVEFVDGSLTTGHADYTTWILSIDDLNDTDKDGIPDFSDDITSQIVQPVLTLTQISADTLVLTIRGEAGKSYTLQQCSTLGSAWGNASTITMTTAIKTVSLPKTAVPNFWRILVQ